MAVLSITIFYKYVLAFSKQIYMVSLYSLAQPNNWKGKQNCGMLTVNALPDSLGLLQDDFCADKYPYICTIKCTYRNQHSQILLILSFLIPF